VLNLETPNKAVEGGKCFLTVYVGGRKETDSESHYHGPCALHCNQPTGFGVSDAVRDERDPGMPMSMARRQSCFGAQTSAAWRRGFVIDPNLKHQIFVDAQNDQIAKLGKPEFLRQFKPSSKRSINA